MDLVREVNRLGGVIPTTFLRRAGARKSAIDAAVRSGLLIRPRNGWIASGDADGALLAAAELGAVLTCVTQAARLGLWEVRVPHPHVAVNPGRHLRRATTAHVHWSIPIVPRDPAVLVDPIENVLAIVADCRPHEEALTIWESALRKGLVDLESLATLPLGPQGRALRAEARPFADAGTETILLTRLRWLRVPMQRQAWILGHRVDLLIGRSLIVQVDGGHHIGAQRSQDNEHDARLRLAGYHVIRVSHWQLMHDWPTVQALITGAIARGLHERPATDPRSIVDSTQIRG